MTYFIVAVIFFYAGYRYGEYSSKECAKWRIADLTERLKEMSRGD